MTRKGKIARLPKEIREELNRRLENGEQGRRLLKWLNGLPEVREVLDREFGGLAISEGSLHEWKKGGFADWKSQQETMALAKEFMASGGDFGTVSDEVVRAVEAATMAHYTAALHRSNSDPGEDPKERLERMRKSLLDVVRLRRCEQAREQLEIQREWLELERQRVRRQKDPEATELSEDCNEVQPMSEEEKAEMLRELLLPKEEAIQNSKLQVPNEIQGLKFQNSSPRSVVTGSLEPGRVPLGETAEFHSALRRRGLVCGRTRSIRGLGLLLRLVFNTAALRCGTSATGRRREYGAARQRTPYRGNVVRLRVTSTNFEQLRPKMGGGRGSQMQNEKCGTLATGRQRDYGAVRQHRPYQD